MYGRRLSSSLRVTDKRPSGDPTERIVRSWGHDALSLIEFGIIFKSLRVDAGAASAMSVCLAISRYCLLWRQLLRKERRYIYRIELICHRIFVDVPIIHVHITYNQLGQPRSYSRHIPLALLYHVRKRSIRKF